MFCTNCGKNREENGNYCEHCGMMLESSPESSINPGCAGQQAQPYFGNYSGNLQNTAYIYAPPIPRKYSHSLTLALIAIGIFFLYYIPSIAGFAVLAGFAISIAALVLGALHLGKRSCAVGGFVIGIILTFFHLIAIIVVLLIIFALI